MQTAVVQIGNGDDKLSQSRWSDFAADVKAAVERAGKVHFSSGSHPFDPWQNACFVVELAPEAEAPLREQLARLRDQYEQESIALIVAETEFI